MSTAPAFAQPSSGAPYPVCTSRPPSSDDVAAAKKTYELGNRYMSEADYDRAIYYFRDAYRSDCTAHKLLGFVARAYELKGDRAEAIRALETYVDRSPTADDRGTVEKRIANLRSQIANQVPVTAPATTATSSATGTTTTPPPVRGAGSGQTLPPGGAPSSLAKDEGTEPAQAGRTGHTAAPWIVFGAGGAVAVGGGVVYLLGAGKVSDAEKACPSRSQCTSQSVVDDGNSGRSQELLGGVLVGVGAAGMAGGLLWHFLERTGPREAKAMLLPSFGPGHAGLVLSGSL